MYQVKAVSKQDWQKSVRYVGNLTIYFSSKETVHVSDGINNVLFERWFDKEYGFYGSHWRPFCTALKTLDNLENIYDVFYLSSKFEIHSMPTKVFVVPKGIKVHPKNYNQSLRRKNAKRNQVIH